jgi:predicted  nucleic acid-binding Zn-ribbon protein
MYNKSQIRLDILQSCPAGYEPLDHAIDKVMKARSENAKLRDEIESLRKDIENATQTLLAENDELREALQDIGDAVGVTEATIPPGSTPKYIARLIIDAIDKSAW